MQFLSRWGWKENTVIPHESVCSSSSWWQFIGSHHSTGIAEVLCWWICLYSLPDGAILTCEDLWGSKGQEASSNIAASFPLSSCSLVRRPLREKGLHLPRGAETPNTEETSRAERLVRWREWSEEFPSVSALHLTTQVCEVVSFLEAFLKFSSLASISENNRWW